MKTTVMLSLVVAVLVACPPLCPGQNAGDPDPCMIVSLMRKYNKDYSVADLTPTLCAAAGLPAPKQCEAKPIAPVVKLAQERFKGNAEKVLVFCPDATGHFLRRQYPNDFKWIVDHSDFIAESTNVMPSVTPVCFGSIFAGVSPRIHGIEKYSRPVIKVTTLFDQFIQAKKKVAIIAVSNCSIDLIFRNRQLDYISTSSDAAAFELTKVILAHCDYDLIISYDGGYDSTMHATGIHSEASQAAMRDSLARYEALVKLTDSCWKEYNRITVFAPDHGAHNRKTGKGEHGTDTPDDILVDHYYSVREKNR